MRVLLTAVLLLPLPLLAGYEDHPRASALYERLRDAHGFNPIELDWVKKELGRAERLPKLVEAEQQAKEKTLGWNDYRALHVTEANIRNGRAFLREYSRSLPRAEARYGVPPAIIAAILGVETKYGAYAGRIRALDALATQGFDHPTRSDFFFNELVEFFALCRDKDFDPQVLRGSYAGALGHAQFMPSNYRRLAVDFNEDGRVDLWNLSDAVGSIARYLTEYDPKRVWNKDQPVLAPATFDGDPEALVVNAKYPTATVGQLAAAGLRAPVGLPPDLPAGALQLVSGEDSEWWIALPNFYAVMSYNPRAFYAMAVVTLAQEIENAP